MKRFLIAVMAVGALVMGCAQPIGDEVGILLADTMSLELAAAVGAETEPRTISITNAGSTETTAAVDADDPWLDVSETVLVIASDDTCFFDVTASCVGLPVGEYEGTVTVTAPNALGSPVVIDVVLQCLGIDDQYEENNIPADASTALYGRPGVWLSDVAGMGVANDDDFYSLEIPGGDWTLTVELIFFDSLGNLELCIQDEKSANIECETSRTDDEIAEVDVTGPGLYILHVYPATGPDIGNAYDLMWNIIPVP